MVEKNSLESFYQDPVLNHLEIIEMGENCRVLILLYNLYHDLIKKTGTCLALLLCPENYIVICDIKIQNTVKSKLDFQTCIIFAHYVRKGG